MELCLYAPRLLDDKFVVGSPVVMYEMIPPKHGAIKMNCLLNCFNMRMMIILRKFTTLL